VRAPRGRGGHVKFHHGVGGWRGGAVWVGVNDERWQRVVLRRCGV
jgi:hypothetical protein